MSSDNIHIPTQSESNEEGDKSKNNNGDNVERESNNPRVSNAEEESDSPGASNMEVESNNPVESNVERESNSPSESNVDGESSNIGDSKEKGESSNPGASNVEGKSSNPGASNVKRESINPGAKNMERESKSPGDSNEKGDSSNLGDSNEKGESSIPVAPNVEVESSNPAASNMEAESDAHGDSNMEGESNSPGDSNKKGESINPRDSNEKAESPGDSNVEGDKSNNPGANNVEGELSNTGDSNVEGDKSINPGSSNVERESNTPNDSNDPEGSIVQEESNNNLVNELLNAELIYDYDEEFKNEYAIEKSTSRESKSNKDDNEDGSISSSSEGSSSSGSSSSGSSSSGSSSDKSSSEESSPEDEKLIGNDTEIEHQERELASVSQSSTTSNSKFLRISTSNMSMEMTTNDDSDVSSIKKMSRYRNPKPPSTIIPELHETKKLFFVKETNHSFGIEVRRKKTRFENVDSGISSFQRMFALKDVDDNIFDFKFSKASDDYIRKNGVEMIDCPFKLSMRDILSLSRNTPINQNVINFCFECFNLYNAYVGGNKFTIPTKFFGKVSSPSKIAVDGDNKKYGLLFETIVGRIDATGEIKDIDLSHKLKSWYIKDFKDSVTDALDFYEKKEIDLKQFITVVPSYESFFLVNVKTHSKEGIIPVIEYVDPNYVDDNELQDLYNGDVKCAGLLFAKYFGLVFKEKDGDELSDEDFVGNDLFQSSLSDSLLNTKEIEDCSKTENGIDSGIICIDTCLDWLRNREVTKKNKSDLMQLRVTILSFISNIYMLFNGENYDIIKEHAKFASGSLSDPDDIEFFKKVHRAFDNGSISIDLYQGTHANSQFKKYKRLQDTFNNLHFAEESRETQTNADEKEQGKDSETTTNSPKKKKKKTKEKIVYEDDNRDPAYLEDNLQKLEIATMHTSKNYLFDVTNKKCFLWHEKSDRNKMPHLESKVRYSDQFVKELFDFFLTQFKETEGKDLIQLRTMIKSSMRKHETHFVMDTLKDDPDNFQICAAMIIDPLRFFRENDKEEYEKYTIIHCVACKDGWKKQNHFDKLLDNLIYSQHLNFRGFFFVKTLGKFEYKKKKALQAYLDKHHYRDRGICFNMVTRKYLYPESTVLFSMGQDVFEVLGKNKKSNNSMRFLRIMSDSFLFARFNDKKVFQLYTHPYGWRDATALTEDYLSANVKRLCKSKPMKKYKMKDLGYRSISDDTKLDTNDRIYKLDEKFNQEYYKKSYGAQNNCAWLSLAAMIDYVDEKAAERMISNMKSNITDYNWMYINKIPPSERAQNPGKEYSNIVAERLKDGIGFAIQKVSDVKANEFLDYILQDAQGLYLLGLESQQDQISHCICVDTDNKQIFDSMEDYVIRLNENNLNMCVGVDQLGVKNIAYCFKVIAEMRKKNPSKTNSESKDKRKRQAVDDDDTNAKKKKAL